MTLGMSYYSQTCHTFIIIPCTLVRRIEFNTGLSLLIYKYLFKVVLFMLFVIAGCCQEELSPLLWEDFLVSLEETEEGEVQEDGQRSPSVAERELSRENVTT